MAYTRVGGPSVRRRAIRRPKRRIGAVGPKRTSFRSAGRQRMTGRRGVTGAGRAPRGRVGAARMGRSSVRRPAFSSYGRGGGPHGSTGGKGNIYNPDLQPLDRSMGLKTSVTVAKGGSGFGISGTGTGLG